MKPMYLDKDKLVQFFYKNAWWLSDIWGNICFEVGGASFVSREVSVPPGLMSPEAFVVSRSHAFDREIDLGKKVLKTAIEVWLVDGKEYYFNHRYTKNIKKNKNVTARVLGDQCILETDDIIVSNIIIGGNNG